MQTIASSKIFNRSLAKPVCPSTNKRFLQSLHKMETFPENVPSQRPILLNQLAIQENSNCPQTSPLIHVFLNQLTFLQSQFLTRAE